MPVFVDAPAPTDEELQAQLLKALFVIDLAHCQGSGYELNIIASTSLTLTTLLGASQKIAM